MNSQESVRKGYGNDKRVRTIRNRPWTGTHDRGWEPARASSWRSHGQGLQASQNGELECYLGRSARRRSPTGHRRRQDLPLDHSEPHLHLVGSAGVDRDVDQDEVRVAPPQPAGRRLTPMRGAVVHDPEDPGCGTVGPQAHDLIDQPTPAGLDRGSLVGRDHLVLGSQRPPLPVPGRDRGSPWSSPGSGGREGGSRP